MILGDGEMNMKHFGKGPPLFSSALAIAIGMAFTTSNAAVSLPGLFSDHMVLQRGMPIPVFGAASANETITVKLGTVQADGKADASGRFVVNLPAQVAGGPFTMTVSGSNTVTLQDVYVGEVWIGSGQSNMDYRVTCTFSGCALKDAAKEIAAANYPLIRSINIERKGAGTPQTAMTTKKWLVCSPSTVGDFSAAGYFFARELHQALPNVAIGIVHASYGASTIECWISKEALTGLASFKPLLDTYEKATDHTDQHNPYNCYNGQIYPIKPYAVRGVIWYQGESLTRGEATYRDLQVELVNSWRREWGQDMTFIITQLAGHYKDTKPLLREAQMQGSQMVSNAGLVVTIDIGDSGYVHPPDKQDVGLRMGLVARAITYKEAIHYSGPLYNRMAVEGSSIRIYFKYASGGLLLKGTANDTTFQIAGTDGKFVRATAIIDQDTTLLISAASVTAPKNVHYAFTFYPKVTLFSKATPTLPASPFRTEAPAFVEAPTGTRAFASMARASDFNFQARRGSSGDLFFVYTLSYPAQVALELFDIRGKKWSLDPESLKPSGSHSVQVKLSGTGSNGKIWSSEGLYYARLMVDGQTKVIPIAF
jgi:sialate O-acetylesterase